MGGNDHGATAELGTVKALPGEICYGYLDVLELPTGITERLPVILAQGRHDGPTFWLTANIHGNEYTGLLAVQRALHEHVAPHLARLRGQVVAIPSLNPAGLRNASRQPYYDDVDPNRTFPEPEFARKEEDGRDPPGPYEQISARLYDALRESADLLVDLHCAHIQSVPFTIRDRVLYRGVENRATAEAQAMRLDGLAHAFGLPVVNEFPPRKYMHQKLHRSTAGAALNEAGIPSITPELGPSNGVDPACLRAAVAGIRNVLIWAGMLEGEMEVLTWIPQPDLGFRVRRENYPRSPATGIIHHLRQPGEIVHAGDAIAELRDIHGRPVAATGEDGLIRTDQDGWVIGLRGRATVFPNSSVATMAIRDDGELIEEWPL
jgi:predicted deacylase